MLYVQMYVALNRTTWTNTLCRERFHSGRREKRRRTAGTALATTEVHRAMTSIELLRSLVIMMGQGAA